MTTDVTCLGKPMALTKSLKEASVPPLSSTPVAVLHPGDDVYRSLKYSSSGHVLATVLSAARTWSRRLPMSLCTQHSPHPGGDPCADRHGHQC